MTSDEAITVVREWLAWVGTDTSNRVYLNPKLCEAIRIVHTMAMLLQDFREASKDQ